jgi:nicotinic acid mononucleotide adenylyltransferase
MHKTISKKRLNNRRRVKKTRRHNMKGGSTDAVLSPAVKKIVLYGLSANPPTKAHENIIAQLSENYNAVFVWASTNLLKLDPNNSSYDPLYKDEKTRSQFLMKVLTRLYNVKVDYNPDGTPAKYNDQYTGISVKKFIDANLVSNGTINSDGNNFKNFKLNKKASLENDVGFLNTCGITGSDTVELWVCFGTDVVRDTPTWTPNNVFLTKATGIVMIPRKGIKDLGDGLYSKVYKKPASDASMPNKIYRFKMPFLDCTTIDKNTKQFIKKDLKFDAKNFPELFADTDMRELAQKLITESHTQFDSIHGEKTPVEKRDEFLGWLSAEKNNQFSLLIEESDITLADTFAEASSTKVRNLAVQSILGNKRSKLDTELIKYVNCRIIEDIYVMYGTPTIPEQLAIIVSKGSDELKNNLADKIKTTKNYADVVNFLKQKVLEIMQV